MLAVLPPAAAAQQIATNTSLAVKTSNQGGRTYAAASITVTGADGRPASGVVIVEDGSRQLTEATLNSEGQATPEVSLGGGDHALRAVYAGDALHRSSVSATSNTSGQTSTTPNFSLSLAAVSPSSLPLTLVAGQSGTIGVTVVPENNAALTSPMFVTLSCSGLPTGASCTFTPETLEILPTTPTSCPAGSPASACPPISSMVMRTQEQVAKDERRPVNPVAWAILLPGILGLGGVAFGARKRRWLRRMALVAIVGLVTTLGMTACKPLYHYYQNGPVHPYATPSGTYTVTVTGQTTNGITATTNSTTFVMTVTGGS